MNGVAPASAPGEIRTDLKLIADMIEPRTRLIDIGCGDGALLHYLVSRKGVDGRGVELSQAGVNACVRHGLAVVQGDADTDLADYPTGAFDVAVLSQTIQATRHPRAVLEQLVRIGRRVVVSFPNFGYWRVRWRLLTSGRMPVTSALPEPWYETPNIHFCTIDDFTALAASMHVAVERAIVLGGDGRPLRFPLGGPLTNLLGEQAVFLLRRD